MNETLQRQSLTERQLEVVRLVTQGFPNKELAARLGVSQRAIEATLTRVYARLGVANRSGLIALVLSEADFGLTTDRRSTPSGLGAIVPRTALEPEARAYEGAPFMVAASQGREHWYTFVNRAAADVAGRPADSLVGRRVKDVFPDLPAELMSGLDEAFRTGRPWSNGIPAEVTLTLADGSIREGRVNMIFQPVRDASGAVVGLLHIGTEETEEAP